MADEPEYPVDFIIRLYVPGHRPAPTPVEVEEAVEQSVVGVRATAVNGDCSTDGCDYSAHPSNKGKCVVCRNPRNPEVV